MTAQLSVNDLVSGASHLGVRDFDVLFREILSLRAKRVAPILSEQESRLLEKIYEKLPRKTAERYADLTEKRRAETLPEDEYQELLTLVQVSENHNVQRLQHIVELASLRQITPQELMKQLGLMPLLAA